MQEARLKREFAALSADPPAGITCRLKNDSMIEMEADIAGPAGTPYAEGVFKLNLIFPGYYPFQPPITRFVTRVYHPNIDTNGRICLDLLKMPPAGGWNPSIGIKALLVAIQMLLANPNLEDPLMDDIAQEYKNQRDLFDKNAKEYTAKYAT